MDGKSLVLSTLEGILQKGVKYRGLGVDNTREITDTLTDNHTLYHNFLYPPNFMTFPCRLNLHLPSSQNVT